MKLKVLGSGSLGNCYLLENDTECLVIEAGLPFMEVKKAIDFNIRKINSVVISHKHLDHARYVAEYEKAGIPVFKPYEGMKSINLNGGFGFKIRAFDLVHDVPCYGFHITHPEMGTLVYASDTEYIKWRFQKANHFLVEANYSIDFVDKDNPNYEHVMQGHMSIETVCEFLKVNNNPALRTVTLCHLSKYNAESSDFKSKAEEVVGCGVNVAKKGLEVDLNLVPF